MAEQLVAPFPYFGGKRKIASVVWERFGEVTQYIEPFFGSGAVLLGAPKPANLEIVGDLDCMVANFWRAVTSDYRRVARWMDYPVSHIDLCARKRWLKAKSGELEERLANPEWPGDHKAAGWWAWALAASIRPNLYSSETELPNVTQPGKGFLSLGSRQTYPSANPDIAWTSGGAAALQILQRLATRLERTRIIHAPWERILGRRKLPPKTAVFLDPPYAAVEGVYREATQVASDVVAWARDNTHLRIALCAHEGDYDMPGWTVARWKRRDGGAECVWFSPACLPPKDSPGKRHG